MLGKYACCCTHGYSTACLYWHPPGAGYVLSKLDGKKGQRHSYGLGRQWSRFQQLVTVH